jgi:hypothetical protein
MREYIFKDDVVRARLLIIPDDLHLLSISADQMGVRLEVGGSPEVDVELASCKMYTTQEYPDVEEFNDRRNYDWAVINLTGTLSDVRATRDLFVNQLHNMYADICDDEVKAIKIPIIQASSSCWH